MYHMVVGLEDNEEVPDYDLDSEDDEWLSVQSKERVSWATGPDVMYMCTL